MHRITSIVPALLITLLPPPSPGEEGQFMEAGRVELRGVETFGKDEILDMASLETAPPFTFRSPEEVERILLEKGLFRKVEVSFDPEDSLLTISLEENPVLKEITFDGVSIFEEEVLRRGMQNREGRVMNRGLLGEDAREIERFYHEQGYTGMRIREVIVEGGAMKIVIDEGAIRRITVEGNRRVSDRKIIKWLSLKEGDIYHSPSIKRGQQAVFNTGLFQIFNIDARQSRGGGMEVEVRAKEKPSLTHMIALAAKEDLLSLSGYQFNRNLFNAIALSVSGSYETPLVERFSGDSSWSEAGLSLRCLDNDPFSPLGWWGGIDYEGRYSRERGDTGLTYTLNRFSLAPGIFIKALRPATMAIYGGGGLFHVKEEGGEPFTNPSASVGLFLESIFSEGLEPPLHINLATEAIYEGGEGERYFGKVNFNLNYTRKVLRYHSIRTRFLVNTLLGDAPYYQDYLLGGEILKALPWGFREVKGYAWGLLEYNLPLYRANFYLSPFYEAAAIPAEVRFADLLDSFGIAIRYQNFGLSLSAGYAAKLYDLSLAGRFFFNLNLGLEI